MSQVVTPLEYREGFVGDPIPPDLVGVGCPLFENLYLDAAKQSIRPIPGFRRMYTYDVLQEATGTLNRIRVMSMPPHVVGRTDGRVLAAVDAWTGRILALTYHPGGVPINEVTTPEPTQLSAAARINRQGNHDYPTLLTFRGRSHLATPWDQQYLFDGDVWRLSGIRAPQIAPVLKIKTSSTTVVEDGTNTWTKGTGLGANSSTENPTDASSGEQYADGEANASPNDQYLMLTLHKDDFVSQKLMTRVVTNTIPATATHLNLKLRFWAKADPEWTNRNTAVNLSHADFNAGISAGTLIVLPSGPAAEALGFPGFLVAFRGPLLSISFWSGNDFTGTEVKLEVKDVRLGLIRNWRELTLAPSDLSAFQNFAYQSISIQSSYDIESLMFFPSTATAALQNKLFMSFEDIEFAVADAGNLSAGKYRVLFSWLDSVANQESDPSPVSNPVESGGAQSFQVDLAGVVPTIDTDLPNEPPEGRVDSFRLYIHKTEWGIDDFGRPLYKLIQSDLVPAAVSSVRSLDIDLARGEAEILSGYGPSYNSRVPPPTQVGIVDGNRIILANQPRYSVGTLDTVDNSYVVTRNDTSNTKDTPIWGPHLEGMSIRIGSDAQLYYIVKALDQDDDGVYEKLWIAKGSNANLPYTEGTKNDTEYEILGAPNRIFYSAVTAQRGIDTEAFPLFNTLNLDMEGDEILALGHVGNFILVLGRRHVYALLPNPSAIDDSPNSVPYLTRPRQVHGAPGILAPRSLVGLPDGSSMYLGTGGRLVIVSSPDNFRIHPLTPRFQGWITDEEKVDSEDLIYSHAVYDALHSWYVLFIQESERSSGSSDGSTEQLDAFGLTDPATAFDATWTQEATSQSWGGRKYFPIATLDGKQYIIGGTKGATKQNDVWESTDNGDTWTQIQASASFSARTFHAAIGFKNKLWVFGGFDSVPVALADIWSSSDGITWTQEDASAPWGTRGGHKVIELNGFLYFIAGATSTAGADGGTGKNDVWRSSDGINWVEVQSTAAFSARDNFGLAVLDNRMYLVGGQVVSPSTVQDVWESADGIAWSQVNTATPGWSARARFGFWAVREMLMMAGGVANAGGTLKEVWVSSDRGKNWVQDTDAGFDAREGMGDYQVDNTVYIAGGTSPDKDDVWSGATTGVGPGRYRDPCIDYGSEIDQKPLLSDFSRALFVDLQAEVIMTGKGWNISAALSASSPCAVESNVPDRIFGGDTKGYINKMFTDDAYGLGHFQKRMQWSVTASTETTVTVDITTDVLVEGQDDLKGLKILLIRASDATTEEREISSNTNSVITITTDWDTNPVSGDTVLIAPMTCSIRWRERRFTVPGSLRALEIGMKETQDQDQLFDFNVYNGSNGEVYADDASVHSNTKFNASDLKRHYGTIPIRQNGGLALLYELTFRPLGEGDIVLGPFLAHELQDGNDLRRSQLLQR